MSVLIRFHAEANIQQDMALCKEALREGNWKQLNKIVAGIAAKARRISEFGHTAVREATDHAFKTTLSQAVSRLDKGTLLAVLYGRVAIVDCNGF